MMLDVLHISQCYYFWLFNILLKGRVQCFSMQVVINNFFLLNPEKKKLVQIRLVFFEKNASLIQKNDVTEPKARLFLTS